MPPIPPILLEGDPVLPALPSGPGGRFAARLRAVPPRPEASAATAPTPEPEWEAVEDYAMGRLWLAARDPFTLHATWDLTPDQLARAGEALALRLYAGRVPEGPFRLIVPGPRERSVFIPVERPAQCYVAEIGYCTETGAWQRFAVSTATQTPAGQAAEEAEVALVMLTLPPEPPPAGQPEGLGAPPAATSPVPKEPLQPTPAAAPSSPISSAEPPAEEAAPRLLPPTQPALPAAVASEWTRAPAAADLRVEPTPPPSPPSPIPAGLSLGTVYERGPERLRRAPVPPWTPAQARAMAAELAALERGRPPSSLVGAAAGPGPARPVVAAVAESSAAAEGPRGLEQVPQAPAPSSAEVGRPALPPGRRFWFNLHAELIVYGATEPDARVTVDSEPIPLRSDGSFTLRFALPDGEYALRAEATAADGVEARAARLEFVRRTTYQGQVGVAPADPTLHPPAARSPAD